MAITDINLSGKVRADDGSGVSGATVTIHHTAADLAGTQEATYSGGTTSDGTWTFTETDLDATYDVKISSSGGGQIRYIPWSDEITLKTVDASVMKIRGVAGAAAPLYFFADRADDAGDAWRINVTDHATGTLAIGSDKAVAGTIIDYFTITNGADAAASTVTVGGILTVTTTLDINGTADFDVTDFDIASSGDIDLVSTNDAAAAIYLRENAGTSGTIKIHADQGTSESSIQLLSDVGGVDINAATGKDVDIAGGTVNLTSSDNAASAIYVRANAGTSETIKVHADQGTSESSIQLLSDAGGVDINAATGKDVDIAGGTVNLTSSDDAASAIYLRANAGTSETIKIHADQGTGAASISAVSDVGGITLDAGLDIVLSADGGNVTMDDGTSTIFDFNVDDTTLTIHDDQDTGDKAVITMAQHGALSIVTTDDDAAAANIQITADGTAELAGTTVTLDSGGDIALEATDDVNIPTDVGITFGDDGEKIEGDGTNLTISANILKINTAAGELEFQQQTTIGTASGHLYLNPNSGNGAVLVTAGIEFHNGGTLKGHLATEDDNEHRYGNNNDYYFVYNNSGTQFQFVAGSGGTIFDVQDGTNDVGFVGGISTDDEAAPTAGIATTVIKIGGSAAHGTTAGTNFLSIFDGTAPVGTLANGISLYSTSGELYAIDAAGNTTLNSPHDSDGNWIFRSKNTNTGRVLKVHMEKLMQRLDEMLGGGFIEDFIEEV
jgi:hypothetical protein